MCLLLNVLLDRLTTEVQAVPVNVPNPPASTQTVTMRQDVDGPNGRIMNAITEVLKLIFADEQSRVQLFIGSEGNRQIH